MNSFFRDMLPYEIIMTVVGALLALASINDTQTGKESSETKRSKTILS